MGTELILAQAGHGLCWQKLLHPLKSILNKILWDKRERAEDYVLKFIHRGSVGDTRTIPLTKIGHIGKSSFTYQDERGYETTIPFHRVTIVMNIVSGKVLWQKRRIAR